MSGEMGTLGVIGVLEYIDNIDAFLFYRPLPLLLYNLFDSNSYLSKTFSMSLFDYFVVYLV